jgi:hypothetical protein
MEIKRVVVITKQPMGDGDPGRCEIGFYKIEKDMVVMCDEAGRSTGKRLALAPGDDPDRVAKRLTRESWLKRGGESDFNRPIRYPQSRLA